MNRPLPRGETLEAPHGNVLGKYEPNRIRELDAFEAFEWRNIVDGWVESKPKIVPLPTNQIE